MEDAREVDEAAADAVTTAAMLFVVVHNKAV